MSELVVKLPDKSTPGYLRRLMKADEFREKMREQGQGAEFYKSLFEFLLTFVIEPEDRDAAREILLDASKEQYMDLLAVINGGGVENPTPAQQSETS